MTREIVSETTVQGRAIIGRGGAAPLDLSCPHRSLRRLAGLPTPAAGASARKIARSSQVGLEESSDAKLSTLVTAAHAFSLEVQVLVRHRDGAEMTSRVLAAVVLVPGRTEAELARALGLDQYIVHNALGALRRAGKVWPEVSKTDPGGRMVKTWKAST